MSPRFVPIETETAVMDMLRESRLKRSRTGRYTYRQIAKAVGVSPATVCRVRNDAGRKMRRTQKAALERGIIDLIYSRRYSLREIGRMVGVDDMFVWRRAKRVGLVPYRKKECMTCEFFQEY